MILHVINGVEIVPAACFGHAREPHLVPGFGGILKSLVPPLANILGDIDCFV
jgi:hypothetical protein